MLSLKIPDGQGEPYDWHVDVLAELDSQKDYRSSTLVIDLKPKQNKTNISLYEVMDVWGQSDSGWTPILLRLGGLFVDQNPEGINRESFVRDDKDIDGPIYEFLYLSGSVGCGKLDGLWVPPPASPTNAALLWPGALNYFFRCICERTPDVLNCPPG
ncbi:hypothetical protein [Acidiphilium iwatense]|uniref:hypothetical protein n=1 Tax=Acidiphilium iwatense TaxID=768198 RepID=UPI001F3BCA22|nr:hypothetical protein [Acidiphilium iwatense]